MNAARFKDRPRFYGRLGLLKDLNAQISAARLLGATLTRDTEGGRVEAIAKDGRIIFKALQKGERAREWLMFYNPEFYPRDEQEERAAQIALVESDAKRDPHCGFYLCNGAGEAIGANGQAVAVRDPAEVIALPKFATFQTLRVFVRWARPAREFVPRSMMLPS